MRIPGDMPLCRFNLRALRLAFVLVATLAGGCNSVFGIHQGTPPPPCYDPTGLLIDDMEDGTSDICKLGGRQGNWYTVGDGTSSMLDPAGGSSFTPTMIDGGRGTSHYAARLTGSGFTGWGALMGFPLDTVGLDNEPYDARNADGIDFWMKSNVAVFVSFQIPATTSVSNGGGACVDSATVWNCNNIFGYFIPTPSSDEWVDYHVPFAALHQGTKQDANQNTIGGTAIWTPSSIIDIQFTSAAGSQAQTPGAAFETWVDDIRFYYCDGVSCLPTCDSDMVACPATATTPAGCWPAGTTCSSLLYTYFDGVWGSGPDDVWAVGNSSVSATGVIRHWNGSVWSAAPADALSSLWAVRGSGPNDAWAIGDFGAIARWDGSTWSASNTNTQASLNDVWGSGPNDIWAIANPGAILHWDGSAWSVSTSVPAETLWGLWGSGPDDVWAVGDAGTTLHWNGFAWSTGVSITGASLNRVWGSGPDDVWAVGSNITASIVPNWDGTGTALHWDGTAWSSVAGPFANIALIGVWGSGSDDVWAVGSSMSGGASMHWDGAAWSSVTNHTGSALYGVWGSGPNDVWAVGQSGTTIHWNGTAWSAVPSGT